MATQITMMGKITGPSFSPVAACSTFGVALKLGMDAIARGEAEAVVVGACRPPATLHGRERSMPPVCFPMMVKSPNP